MYFENVVEAGAAYSFSHLISSELFLASGASYSH